jgi:NAD(P)-dependent dehydrogenase (short-subunit alcohol dehydrogenase family)
MMAPSCHQCEKAATSSVRRQVALARHHGRPADAARRNAAGVSSMVAFLASDLASYMSGSAITIDGELSFRTPRSA